MKLYFYALTAHFGTWVETIDRKTPQWQVRAQRLYGQLTKHYRRRPLVRVERRAWLGSIDQLTAALRACGESGTIQSAFVERLNLTMRQAVAPLTRRTWSIAQSSAELILPLEGWKAYYHFTRPHASLSKPLAEAWLHAGKHLPQRCRPQTPAQAAALTDHRGTLVELLRARVPATHHDWLKGEKDHSQTRQRAEARPTSIPSSPISATQAP